MPKTPPVTELNTCKKNLQDDEELGSKALVWEVKMGSLLEKEELFPKSHDISTVISTPTHLIGHHGDHWPPKCY